MEQLRIQEKRGANYSLLELAGALDFYSFTELRQRAFALIREENLVLDLSALTSMDSSGLSVILGSSTLGEEAGRRLYLMRPSAGARRALESTGFMDMLNIIYSVTEVV